VQVEEGSWAMRPVTPRGFRDVLLTEAAERREVAGRVGDVFESWGYGFVETPVVEEYATLEAGAGGSLEGTAFRLFDLDGTLLALRPEMTLPIARVVASRLVGQPGPHRLCYVADVFREKESLRGEARQFAQAGVELVGAAGPAADAEVVAVLVEALEAVGLPSFTVGVGTVAVLRALLAGSGLDDTWQASVMRAAHERNLVEIDRLAGDAALEGAVADALRAVPRLRGGTDAIDRCRRYAAACRCAGAVDALAETWRLLEAAGVASRVSVDFGILRSFEYYTGLIVEAYAPGLGLPLGGGGRYDGVLEAFEAPAPAAGFALSVERVQIALAEQGAAPRVRGLDAVVGGRDAARVLATARALRLAGLRVRVAASTDPATIRAEADASRAAGALLACDDGLVAPIGADGSPGAARPLPVPVPRPGAGPAGPAGPAAPAARSDTGPPAPIEGGERS
jgi:ATP phosphoribosyltransferase